MNIATESKQRSTFTFPTTEVLLLLVAIVWGTSYGLTKSALTYTSVLLFIAIRFSMTCCCLIPFVLNDIAKQRNKDWIVSLPTGFILAAIFFFEVYGVSKTTAANAAFLISLNVIFTAFIQNIINKEKPSVKLITLCASSVFGVLLLTDSLNLSVSLNAGDYCILSAALLRALMVTTTRRLTNGKQIANTTLTFVQSFVVAGCSVVALFTTVEYSIISLPTELSFWLYVTYLVLFCTLLAFFVQNYAVRKISATKTSLLMGSEPLFGAIFAYFWLNETFTALQLFGAAIILISVILTSNRNI
jgi:drug/metabolite transporter (DMT)-like permease